MVEDLELLQRKPRSFLVGVELGFPQDFVSICISDPCYERASGENALDLMIHWA